MSNQYLAQGNCEHIEHIFMLAVPKCCIVIWKYSQTWGITGMSIMRLQTYSKYIMKMFDDCIKQTICATFSHLQWSAASAFCLTPHPSIALCDMLHSLVCKPNFACGEASDHSVAEQRFLCLNQELPQRFFMSSPLTTYSRHF